MYHKRKSRTDIIFKCIIISTPEDVFLLHKKKANEWKDETLRYNKKRTKYFAIKDHLNAIIKIGGGGRSKKVQREGNKKKFIDVWSSLNFCFNLFEFLIAGLFEILRLEVGIFGGFLIWNLDAKHG